MSRIPGRVSPAKAARMLAVRTNTVRTWCHKALDGQPSRVQDVRQHPVTHYLTLSLAEVLRLKGGDGEG